MEKIKFKNTVNSIIISVLIIIFSYLPLRYLKINQYNFWMDYNGRLDIIKNIIRYFFIWNQNLFGQLQYSSFSSIPLILYEKLIFTIFSTKFGTFFILYFLVLMTLILGYILIRQFLENKYISFLLSLLFIYNPVFLRTLLTTGTTPFIFCIMGFLISLIFFIKYIKNSRAIYLFLIIISSLLIVHPFVFVFYYAIILYLFTLEKKFKEFLLVGLFIILINSYWLIPFIFSSFSSNPDILLSNRADSVKNVLESQSGLVQSLLFTIRGFSVIENIYGFLYITIILIWLFLLFLLLFIKKLSLKFTLYSLPIIIMLLFSIGGISPLGIIFNLLWKFSFFHFFRSFSNVLIILWYYLLFFILVVIKEKNLLKNEIFKYTLIFIIIFPILPLIFTSNISAYGGSTIIPNEYIVFQKYINDNVNDFKILQLPFSNYDYYIWDTSGKDKYFFQAFYNKGLIYSPIDTTFNNKTFIGNIYIKIYNGDNLDFLKYYNIKYIIYRKDLDYSERNYYKSLKYINTTYTKNIINNTNFEVYEINNIYLIIYSNDLKFEKINPTKYKIYIKDFSKIQNLSFLESYNKDWKLYLIKNPTSSWCKPIEFYNDMNTTECEHNQKFFEGNELSYLYEKPIFDESHQIIFDYANGWTIDPQYIKDHYSKDYYTENPDGSINIELIMYFKPQSYFYIGLIISGLTLISCIIYLIYDYLMNRKAKKH